LKEIENRENNKDKENKTIKLNKSFKVKNEKMQLEK